MDSKMNKTPASLLQEVSTKYSIPLKYEELPTISVSGQARFVVRAICGNHKAEGTALTKKGAKHDAAAKMVKILVDYKLISKELGSVLTIQDETLNESLTKFDSPDTSLNNDATENITNFVGVLNEYCQINGLSLPKFDCCGMTGTPNNPTFTIECSVSSIKGQGSANTKKKAKHKAAESVINLLKIDTKLFLRDNSVTRANLSQDQMQEAVKDLGVEIEQLNINNGNSLPLVAKSVKEQYLRFKNKSMISSDLISEQHMVVYNIINSIPYMQKRHLLSMHGKENSIAELTSTICNTFKIQQIDKYDLRSKNCLMFLVVCKINIVPPLVFIGAGATVCKAEQVALSKILGYIVWILKSD